MSASTPPFPLFVPRPLALTTAAMEVLGYLAILGIGSLCFLLGWLSPNGAAVLTVILLAVLIVLAWKRFDQGRHPCFLFLCMLMLLQGGRLVAYCAGVVTDPLQVRALTPIPFTVSRDEAGIVLLSLALSAICVYAPARWNYRHISPPSTHSVQRFLPYLYILLIASVPVQLFKNYRYLQYAQEHGGYLFLFLNHQALASSVPLLVRVIPLISVPAFVAIFVFEQRRKLAWTAAALYFGAAAPILLLGSRGTTFTLIVALWYIARFRSTKRVSSLGLLLLAVGLMLAAGVIGTIREDLGEEGGYLVGPMNFIAQQGISLDVTEVAVRYRNAFQPHIASYLAHELQGAFVASGVYNYVRGNLFAVDVSVLLSGAAYDTGLGTGGSYLAESYVIGGLCGVVLISLLIGFGLNLLYIGSRTAAGLLVVAMIVPDVAWMARGPLLGWVSSLARNAISFVLLAAGWGIYSLLRSMHGTSRSTAAT
jgi:O-antigen polysaccharide polymerase Wzy